MIFQRVTLRFSCVWWKFQPVNRFSNFPVKCRYTRRCAPQTGNQTGTGNNKRNPGTTFLVWSSYHWQQRGSSMGYQAVPGTRHQTWIKASLDRPSIALGSSQHHPSIAFGSPQQDQRFWFRVWSHRASTALRSALDKSPPSPLIPEKSSDPVGTLPRLGSGIATVRALKD